MRNQLCAHARSYTRVFIFCLSMLGWHLAIPSTSVRAEVLRFSDGDFRVAFDPGDAVTCTIRNGTREGDGCTRLVSTIEPGQSDVLYILDFGSFGPVVLSIKVHRASQYAEEMYWIFGDHQLDPLALVRATPTVSERRVTRGVPILERSGTYYHPTDPNQMVRMRTLGVGGRHAIIQLTLRFGDDDVAEANQIFTQLEESFELQPTVFLGANPLATPVELSAQCEAGSMAACGEFATQLLAASEFLDLDGAARRVAERSCSPSQYAACTVLGELNFSRVFRLDRTHPEFAHWHRQAADLNADLCNGVIVDPPEASPRLELSFLLHDTDEHQLREVGLFESTAERV